MVVSGHESGPAEPLDGIGNSSVVRRYDDPRHQTSLGHTSINMLYQGFSFDFGYWFTRETSGIESGGDDRYCGINLHQTPQFILARGAGQRRSFGRKLALQVFRHGGEI